jgi:hypothetical protein
METFHVELLLLVKKLISLYLTRNDANLLTQANEEDIRSGMEAATDATYSAKKSAEEETAEAATDAMFAVMKIAEEETLDDQVAAEDENVAAAVDEKVSPAPYKEVITNGPKSDSVLRSMRESFYKVYSKHFESVRGEGTSVMTRAMYDHKVQLLIDAESELYKGKPKPQVMKNALSRFMLLSQVKGSQLYQRTKGHPTKIPYLEILFDIIHKAHLFLAHAKESRVTKVHIDGHWWGIPENAVKVYRNLCPQCLRHSHVSK